MTKTTRQALLEKAIEYITKNRQDTYGKPENNFQVIANLWSTFLDSTLTKEHGKIVLTCEDIACMMILMKVARIIQCPEHEDNWVDIAGYAACGGEIAIVRADA